MWAHQYHIQLFSTGLCPGRLTPIYPIKAEYVIESIDIPNATRTMSKKILSRTSDMKLIIIGIFFVACLLTNFEVESSAQNRDNVVGLLLRPTSKSSPIQRSSRPQRVLSGIERFYGTRGTRGCPRRKILTLISEIRQFTI